MTSSGSSNSNEIGIIEIWEVLSRNFLTIAAITFASILLTFVYLLFQPEIYRSEVLLAPSEARQPTSPLLNQFGAAANFVGINFQDEQSTRVDSALALIRSRNFVLNFVEKYNLSALLLASSYSAEEGESFIDADLYDVTTNSWVNDPPTDTDIYDAFLSSFSVSTSIDSDLITIALEREDPRQAQQWLELAVNELNLMFKQQDLAEASSAIEYLQKQLDQTMLVEMQRVFYDLIESQTRIVMLADVRDEYVFRILDPAFLPENPVRPRRLQVLFFGTLLGITLGLLVAWIRFFLFANRNDS